MSDLLIKEKVKENLKLLEQKSLIPEKKLKIFILISSISFITGILDYLFSLIICMWLPFFWTILSLFKNEQDLSHWIIYWIIYSVIYSFEVFSIQEIFPLFHILKCIILIYLYFPNTKGTMVIHKYIKKILPKSKENGLKLEIEKLLNKIK
jgi:hypothetical protein